MSALLKPSYKWSEASRAASALIGKLLPHCEQIKVVGSVRRRRTFVSDIEILAEPSFDANPESLFEDDSYNCLHGELDKLLALGVIGKDPFNPKWGNRYRRFLFEGIHVDCFICLPPAHWGVLEFIRTGPVTFTKPYITQAQHGGLLPPGFKVEDGQLLDASGFPCHVPDEQAFFDILGRRYVEPELRR